MEHDREREAPREREVPAEHRHLPVEGGAGLGRPAVEPALAYRHRAPAAEGGLEVGEPAIVAGGVELRQELRVDPEAEVEARRRRGQGGEARPSVRSHRRDDDVRHPHRPGPGERLGAVRVERGAVQVAVGVDHRTECNARST